MTDIETQREEHAARNEANKLQGSARERYESLRSEGWSAYTAMEIIAAGQEITK